jgi:ATP-dependent metalloprotease FtsH
MRKHGQLVATVVCLALAAGLIAAVTMLPATDSTPEPAKPTTETYSQLERAVRTNALHSILVHSDSGKATAFYNDGHFADVVLPGDDGDFLRRAADSGAEVEVVGGSEGGSSGFPIASLLMPLLLIGLIGFFVLSQRRARQNGGGMGMPDTSLRKSTRVDEVPRERFANVAGCDEAVEELAEVVAFFHDADRFRRLGARPPSGIILHGEPGTGKTLLARALAGEAGVPFFAVSGSDFMEKFVGVGASRVRELFGKARAHEEGAVVFIDEIDAVGRARTSSDVNGEREQTLNQLLVELDGFSVHDKVICIAATNRLDVLDPALLRPGRFGRHVAVPLPSAAGRASILRLHARSRPLAAEVDLEAQARMMGGLSGAELAEVVNEAAIMAAREGAPAIASTHFAEGYLRVLAGPKRRSAPIAEGELEVIAAHEAGHVICAEYAEQYEKAQQVTIEPRGRAMGLAVYGQSDRALHDPEYLHEAMVATLGGRAAEQTVFGRISSGAANDLQKATALARRAVEELGFSPRFGHVVAGASQSEGSRAVIDGEVERMVAEAYADALALLAEHRDQLDRLSTRLVEQQVLERVDILTAIGKVVKLPKRTPAQAPHGRAKRREPETRLRVGEAGRRRGGGRARAGRREGRPRHELDRLVSPARARRPLARPALRGHVARHRGSGACARARRRAPRRAAAPRYRRRRGRPDRAGRLAREGRRRRAHPREACRRSRRALRRHRLLRQARAPAAPARAARAGTGRDPADARSAWSRDPPRRAAQPGRQPDRRLPRADHRSPLALGLPRRNPGRRRARALPARTRRRGARRPRRRRRPAISLVRPRRRRPRLIPSPLPRSEETAVSIEPARIPESTSVARGHTAQTKRRKANGTLVLGGGFGGAYVARLLGKEGATIVSPESSMLYTPLLPEVAAGALEPRHAVIPLRMMAPYADVVRGRLVALDDDAQVATIETDRGPLELEYDRAVLALGAVPRHLPIPGLEDHTLDFKDLGDAIYLRDHVLRQLDAADQEPDDAERHLTFVFVGAGYAGVEALAELKVLVEDSLRHFPRLRELPRRWVLVDAGPKILQEVPGGLGDYAALQLQKRGVEIRSGTTLEAVDAAGVTLSDGSRIETETVVWTAGITANPLLRVLGVPVDERGRVVVDSSLRVAGRTNLYAVGDCAAVPNEATPGRVDPPTCQHALRQARRVVKTLRGATKPYRYRSLGQCATLGRDKGIALVLGIRVRGFLGQLFARWYHLRQVPLVSRRVRVLADGMISVFFRRDMADMGSIVPSPRDRRA